MSTGNEGRKPGRITLVHSVVFTKLLWYYILGGNLKMVSRGTAFFVPSIMIVISRFDKSQTSTVKQSCMFNQRQPFPASATEHKARGND